MFPAVLEPSGFSGHLYNSTVIYCYAVWLPSSNFIKYICGILVTGRNIIMMSKLILKSSIFFFLIVTFLVLVVGVGDGTKILSKMLKGSKVSWFFKILNISIRYPGIPLSLHPNAHLWFDWELVTFFTYWVMFMIFTHWDCTTQNIQLPTKLNNLIFIKDSQSFKQVLWNLFSLQGWICLFLYFIGELIWHFNIKLYLNIFCSQPPYLS